MLNLVWQSSEVLRRRITLIAELSDGYCGYVPIPEAIRHGGYSATSADHTRLVPEGGSIIAETTQQLLAQVFGDRIEEQG